MELLYFWIKKYRNLKNIDFNLSNKEKFHYNPETRGLSEEQSSNYFPYFFGNNISHVTGIFGANGAGKTNTLRLMMESLISGRNNKVKDAIFIYSDKNKYYLYSQGITITQLNDRFIQIDDLERFRSSISFIFFSNHFDSFNLELTDTTSTQYRGQYNISTNFLVRNDCLNRLNRDPKFQQLSFDQTINIHNKTELNRQVRLSRKYRQRELLVGTPKYIVISISDVDEEQLKDKADNLFKDLELLGKKAGNQKRIRFLFYLFKALILNILNQINFSAGVNQDSIIDSILNNLERIAVIDTKFSIDLVETFVAEVKNSIETPFLEHFAPKFDNISVILKNAEMLIRSNNRVSHDDKAFYLNIVDDSLQVIDAFFSAYIDNQAITEALDFRFSFDRFAFNVLSSGEYALLALFGRINSVLKKDLNKNIILLLDEAELSLHPHWQVCFLKTMLNFMVKEFAEKKVQIILTSHSPFIVSDLPSNCIILLERDGYKVKLKEQLSKNKETFGANIHHLFMENFFMQDSLMGEFAREKINDLAKVIYERDTFSPEEYDFYKRSVQMIGEPFIRTKLLEKLINGAPMSAIDKLIEQKNLELQQLIDKKNDQDSR